MKLERLIGIITILQQKDKVTMAALAERFEVSCRTIQRDIDALCKAGIPIASMQGYGGGLAIADGYKFDKTILTKSELQAILAGLKSIDSISKNAFSPTVLEKFSGNKNTVFAEQGRILIDLASWYQDSLSEKIEQIKQAIFRQESISFKYYSQKGQSDRIIEPYLIIFKWSAWYVYGYCPAQGDCRLFKLNRLWQLQNTNIHFEPREIPETEIDFERFFQINEIKLIALFDESEQYRLIEEYGVECFYVLESGKLLFQRTFSNMEYLRQWLLSFGASVKVLEPTELAVEIYAHAKNMLTQYQ